MGAVPVNRMILLPNILILLAVLLVVFLQGAFNGVRHLLGAQVDLLPALMVYTALTSGPAMMMTLAVLGGLMFDTLSVNPLGVSVLPLLLFGFLLQLRRDLLLREQLYAQFALGLIASALAPVMTVLILLTLGQSPLLGWGSLWQWIVMSVGGGIATPVFFFLFDRLNHALGYQPIVESSFRTDREIRRGRN
jgi:rod shape-determining protein MreD